MEFYHCSYKHINYNQYEDNSMTDRLTFRYLHHWKLFRERIKKKKINVLTIS